MNQIDYNDRFRAFRWIGYFDLLGTKELVQTNKFIAIFEVYKNAIGEFNTWKERLEDIHTIWFSDTFILYSEDNSVSGFGELDHIARWFYYYLIKEGIPVRGSISYGDFYCDRKNSLFFGEPLIEAYQFGEAQNWLGLIICPSAEYKLKPLNILTEKSSAYVYTEVPFKNLPSTVSRKTQFNILPACILACWLPPDFQKNISEKLHQMMNSKNAKYKPKYKNTINFLRENPRYINL